MILNDSATSSSCPAIAPAEELSFITNYTFLARSQTMLNFYLHKDECNVEAPLSLIMSLVGGDCIVQGSVDPGKLSLILLGNSLLHNNNSLTEKESLKLQLQETYDNQLYDENIAALILLNFVKINCHADLVVFVKNSKIFLCVILGDNYIFVVQLSILWIHLEDESILYECAFKSDPLFGMTFVHALERVLQNFLTKHMDRASIVQIDPSFYDISFYDISFLTSMMQHQRFAGMLPPCLMESASPKFISEDKDNNHTPRKNGTTGNQDK